MKKIFHTFKQASPLKKVAYVLMALVVGVVLYWTISAIIMLIAVAIYLIDVNWNGNGP